MNFEIALQRLVEFSKQRESASFDIFFNETKDLIYRVAFHYMRCDSEAEDILQSVFLKIFTYAQEKPNNIKEIKNLKSWLIQIAVNASKMSIRAKIRQRKKNMKKKSETNSFSNEKEELYQQVTKYLSDLPEKYRLPVCLHYVENMSFADISTTLKIDQPTLKVQASRGIAKLREILQKAGVAISSTSLSSILAESNFQKAPANITFQKTTMLKSARLEQVLRYNEKTIHLRTPFFAIFTLSILGFISIYFIIENMKSEPFLITKATKKTFTYNFEDVIPKDVLLPSNSQLSIEKGKGLVFPLNQKESVIAFPEVFIRHQPFSVVNEIYNTYPEPTIVQSLFGVGSKKQIWNRPSSLRGNDWNHFKTIFLNPYEISFIKNVPVAISLIEIDQKISNEILKFSYGNTILKSVTIQSLEQPTLDELKKYISSKVKAKQAVSANLDINDLVGYKQKGIYTIPKIQNLKTPFEVFIKMKENISVFNNFQIYFLDDKDSLTIKSYGKTPEAYGASRNFHIYLFDEICLISKDNEPPSLIFEAKSLFLNKSIGFEFDIKLIESIQIIPVKNENEIFIKSQNLFNTPSGQIELKLN